MTGIDCYQNKHYLCQRQMGIISTTMKNARLQKEINSIAKLKMITGELFIEVEIKAENGLELNEKCDSILSNLVIPEGLDIYENQVYRKDLNIFISFKKI